MKDKVCNICRINVRNIDNNRHTRRIKRGCQQVGMGTAKHKIFAAFFPWVPIRRRAKCKSNRKNNWHDDPTATGSVRGNKGCKDQFTEKDGITKSQNRTTHPLDHS